MMSQTTHASAPGSEDTVAYKERPLYRQVFLMALALGIAYFVVAIVMGGDPSVATHSGGH